MKILKSFGTHDGSFHADEVTACALLIFFDLVKKDLIYRTRDRAVLNKCEYVCDVLGIYNPKKKIFDHHQADYEGDLSSAGMVLKYLKNQNIISKNFYEYLNNSFIRGVDYHDIGKVEPEKGFCTFSDIIFSFLPVGFDLSLKDFENAYMGALDFTLGYLKRLEIRFLHLQEAKKIIKKHMRKKEKYLIFERSFSWVDGFFELGGKEHPALFIVMPTGKHWKLRGIPPSFDERMKVGVPLPEEWAGLRDEELKKVSKIDGAIFCHKGRFISIFETKEDALKALKYVLKKQGERV
jgi:uncharacterized UPF0160 family protein